MPRMIVDNTPVEVPPMIAGSEVLERPEVKRMAGPKRTVFMTDPDGQNMRIVDPAANYAIQDGTIVDAQSPAVSGGR